MSVIVLVGVKHENLSELDELVTAISAGSVDVLTLIFGAGGVALGAHQTGRVQNVSEQR